MAISRKTVALTLVAALALVAGTFGGRTLYALARLHQRAAVARELAAVGHLDYKPQKAVYHVDYGGGWFGRNYSFLIDVLEAHERVVGPDKLRLAVVLQGNGLDLLIAAKTDPVLAERIDVLKKNGVRFFVCKNSLIARAVDPFKDLYGVAETDIVPAAVAELVALQQNGYVYLHL